LINLRQDTVISWVFTVITMQSTVFSD